MAVIRKGTCNDIVHINMCIIIIIIMNRGIHILMQKAAVGYT
jgi:hypothetical protein